MYYKALFFLFVLLSASTHAESLTLNTNNKNISISTETLRKLPIHKIKTATNYTSTAIFSGVRFSDLFKLYDIKGNKIRIYALDDYSYSIAIDELYKYNAILAYLKNGEKIKTSELGPFVSIFPRDDHPELKKFDVDAKTVWQISRIEVK